MIWIYKSFSLHLHIQKHKPYEKLPKRIIRPL